MEEKLLTTREVSHILGMSEKDIIEMANADLLPHFKVAGEFVRFKRKDILQIKDTIKRKYKFPDKENRRVEQLKEFLYFNDFYIICTGIILVLLWIILKDFYC